MSCEITVKSFDPIEIEVEGCNKEDIISLENMIVCALNQKIERLGLLTKNCNVYSYGGNILINDAYNSSKELFNLINSLGFLIKEVSCELKGKTYIVSDKLLSTLRNFAKDYEFGNSIANDSVTVQVKNIIEINKFETELDYKILDMVLNIKENGKYLELAKQEVTTDYKDNKIINAIKGDIISSDFSIKEEFFTILKNTKAILDDTNVKLKEATASIITYRAKQMGYSIKEVRNGDKIELQLERCE